MSKVNFSSQNDQGLLEYKISARSEFWGGGKPCP